MGAREKTGTGVASLMGKLATDQIDLSGSLTGEGFQSVYQAAVTSAAEGIQRSSDFNNQGKMNDVAANASKRAYEMTKQTTGDTKKAEEKAKEVLNELSTMMNDVKFDDKGNITDGDFVAKTGDMMAKTIGEGAGRRYTEKMQGSTFAGLTFDMKDGQVSGSIADGSKVDLANKVEAGNQTSPVITDPQFATLLEKNGGDFDKAYTQYQTQKLLHHNASWQNQLGMAVSGIMPGDTPEEKANNAMIAGAVVAGGVGLYVGEKASKMMMDPVKQAMSVKDLTEENGFYKNDEGGYTNKNGTKFNVGEDGGVYREGSPIKEYQDAKKGFVSRSAEKTVDLFKNTTDKLRGVNDETFDNSPSSSTDTDNTKTNKTPDDHISNHSNSSLKDNNTIISQNEEGLNSKNSKSKEILKNAVQNQISELDKNINNMPENEYISKHMELSEIEDRLDKGKTVHTKALSNLGINTRDLGLSLDDKGNVDIGNSDAKFEKASKAYESALEKQTAKDTTSLDTPESSKPQAISLGSQTAQDRWLDEKIKQFDPDMEKGSAAIKTLEGFKGQDLGALDDFWKKKIGLDSN